MLKKNYKENVLAMHMPGHKRKPMGGLPTDIDITEIEGFGNLMHVDNILGDLQAEAAEVFGAERAFFVVNGSTGAVLSSIVGLTQYGDEVIMTRNCHKSVYSAIEINGLKPTYIAPNLDENGIAQSITVGQIEEAIKKAPKATIVIVTCPTFEGVVSDIKSIAEVIHKSGKKLIVDSAHGAHFGFWGMPEHANKCGADVVICSLHKTLPAMTSTSLLFCKKELGEIIAKYVTMFQTTSPSYVLMASIVECVNLLKTDGSRIFKEYVVNLKEFSEGTKQLKHLKVLCNGFDSKQNHKDYFDYDFGKIVILTTGTNITGPALMSSLRKQKIEAEMSYNKYVIAMTSIFDTKADLKRLLDALILIDKTLSQKADKYVVSSVYIPEFVCRSSDLKPLKAVKTEIGQSLGKVSAEYIWVYPPGIPIVVPGEKIDKKILDILKVLQQNGLKINSTGGQMPGFVFVADK
jgi:arginine/lysine/ornithine decarboxylase